MIRLFEKFADDIEWDFEDRGIRLYDYFDGLRPWPQFVRYLSKLDQGTRYHAAMLQDEEIAQDALAKHIEAERNRGVLDKAEASRGSFVGFTREVQLLTTLINAVFQHIVVTGSMFGGKPGSPPRLPVPRSRFEELVDRYDNSYSNDLAARFGLD